MRVLLQALDLILLLFHLGVVLFLLFGWLFPAWRRAHRWLVLIVTLSWFALGAWFGIGYCFLTDWHWAILERLGRGDLPNSFIKYVLDGATGVDWDPRLIDLCTAGGFVFALVAAIWTGWRDRRGRTKRTFPPRGWNADYGFLIVTLLAGAIGLGRAISLSWTSDDAFISFRYALNWSRGTGLVFNAGETVEGYTNFLWTALLTLAAIAGLDLERAANVLSITAYAALFGVVAWRGQWLVAPDGSEGTNQETRMAWLRTIPLVWPALALHLHLSVYATSGLETMLFTLLVTWGLLEIARGDTRDRGEYGIGLALLVLAAMTRPDGLLFYASAGAFAGLRIWQRGQRSFRDIVRPHLALLLVYLPYWCIRFAYYGLPWPNTFYAKSASDPYPSQGLAYLGLYFLAYWPLLPLIALSIFTGAGRFRRARRDAAADFFTSLMQSIERVVTPGLLIGVICFSWWLYIVWVGGDFMFARFLAPITPLLLLVCERSLRANGSGILRTPQHRLAFAGLLGLGMLLYYDPYRGRQLPVIADISEEHLVYSRANRRRLRDAALALRPAMQKTRPAVAFYGSQAALIYYWDLDRAIEAETGLTDAHLAARPLAERGRIGHEKQAGRSYLRERQLDWSLRRAPPGEPDFVRLYAAGLGEFEILCYRRRIMERLAGRPEFSFVRIPEYIDDLLAKNANGRRIAEDLPALRRVYFACNPDRDRLKALERARNAFKSPGG